MPAAAASIPRTMFPAPITTATSSPCSCTATISRASDSMRFWSIPYWRSPINASPESFSRTRRNGAACGRGRALATCLPCQRNALEFHDFGAGLLQRVGDGLRTVVDPLLVGEHLLGVEPLVQHALDDLVLCLVGFPVEFVRVAIDVELGCDDVLRDVFPAYPLGP